MNINRDVIINHFEHLKGLMEKEDQAVAHIDSLKDNGVSLNDRSHMKMAALQETSFYNDLTNNALLENFKQLPDDAGYIKHLAAISINVYTSADHGMLKDFLKSKGFLSNEFNLLDDLNNKEPAFKALIGSDSLDGLNSIISDIDTLCGKNDILFERYKSLINNSINNVEVKSNVESVFWIMNKVDSPIVLGSKIDDIIVFDVGGKHDFTLSTHNISNPLVSYNAPEDKKTVKKTGLIAGFLNNHLEKTENAIKAEVLKETLAGFESSCLRYQDNIRNLTDSVIDFNLRSHAEKDPNISILRSYQIEHGRLNDLFRTIVRNNSDYVERSIDNNPEQLKIHQEIIKKYGFKP